MKFIYLIIIIIYLNIIKFFLPILKIKFYNKFLKRIFLLYLYVFYNIDAIDFLELWNIIIEGLYLLFISIIFTISINYISLIFCNQKCNNQNAKIFYSLYFSK